MKQGFSGAGTDKIVGGRRKDQHVIACIGVGLHRSDGFDAPFDKNVESKEKIDMGRQWPRIADVVRGSVARQGRPFTGERSVHGG